MDLWAESFQEIVVTFNMTFETFWEGEKVDIFEIRRLDANGRYS